LVGNISFQTKSFQKVVNQLNKQYEWIDIWFYWTAYNNEMATLQTNFRIAYVWLLRELKNLEESKLTKNSWLMKSSKVKARWYVKNIENAILQKNQLLNKNVKSEKQKLWKKHYEIFILKNVDQMYFKNYLLVNTLFIKWWKTSNKDFVLLLHAKNEYVFWLYYLQSEEDSLKKKIIESHLEEQIVLLRKYSQ
jgi:hypothetical protein